MLNNRWLHLSPRFADRQEMEKKTQQQKQKQLKKKKDSPSQQIRKGQLVREEDTPGEQKSTVGKAGRRMRCSVTLVRSARSRESLQSTQPQKKENIQMHKCPVLPDWAPAIPVICQPPSPFFATLPQSHMEAGLRWVESTTFLLITSKPGDLLGMAWGLALQPPSVNCSSSLLWPQWW